MLHVYKEIKKNPTMRDLVEFGLVFAAGMGVFGAISWFKWGNQSLAQNLWIAGAAVFVLSLIPPIGRILYILWMGLGITIGLVTSPIIMFAVYLVVIVPVGLWFKVTRRDLMRRSLDPNAKSYWEEYPSTEDPTRYVRQF